MKNIFPYILILLLIVAQVYALHDASVNLVGYNPAYETKDVLFEFKVENVDPNNPTVNNPIEFVTLNTSGVYFLKIFNSQSWEHTNFTSNITWNKADGIAAKGSQNFNFDSYLNKVNKDTDLIWNVVTKDSNGDSDTNTFTVTILNDSANPVVSLASPGDYDIVKNETFNFIVNINDPETEIDYSKIAKLIYKDVNTPSNLNIIGLNSSLNLDKQSNGVISTSLNPTASNLPYIDFEIQGVYDNAGNHYSDPSPKHLYVDRDYPKILKNFDSGFITNNLAYPFFYNISDNSFDSISYGFIPHVECNLYIQPSGDALIQNKFVTFITPRNNTPISADLTTKADGGYDSTLVCEDSAGFETTTSGFFNLDTKGPKIDLFYPQNGSAIFSGLDLGLFLTDSAGISSAVYSMNGFDYQFESYVNNETSKTTSTIYLLNTSLWTEGLHTITEFTNDTLNNVNSEEFSFLVDNTPPTVNLLSPLNTWSNSTVLISYNVSDNFDTALNCTTYAFSPINFTEVRDNRLVPNNNQESFNMDLNIQGAWFVVAVCDDDATNAGFSLTNLALVDNSAPNVSSNYPAMNRIFNYTNIEFSYNVSDDGSGMSYCNLNIDNLAVAFNSTEIDQFNPNLINYNVADGTHNWKLNCADLVNNLGFSTQSNFVVDTIKPNITLNYNKLLLEKQLDLFVADFSVIELNKAYSFMQVKDLLGNIIGQANELQSLSLTGLNLGIGNFTVEVFANDTATNNNKATLNFEVLDNLAPKILNTSPVNLSSMSSTNSVNITLTTDENSNCRFTTNSSLSYNNMQDMEATGNRKLHSQTAAVSSGNTFNYYFACSDGPNTMNNLNYLTFSVNAASDGNTNPGNGNGGGGGNNPGPTTIQQTTTNPENQPEATQPTQTTEEQTTPTPQEQTTPQTTNAQSISPLTGFGTFINKVGEYKKEAVVGASVIVLSLLGSYGFVRFRRYKLSKIHRPPFE